MESNNRNDKKQKEADSQFKKGKKALSTGLLKWNPDHLGASLHFESAAKLYKELGNEQKAKEEAKAAEEEKKRQEELERIKSDPVH